MDAAETALLVTAENEADAALEGEATVEEGFGGEEGGIRGAFVVAAAPRIDIAILEMGAVGRVGPAVAFGNYVEMAEGGDIRGTVAKFSVSGIPVHVFGTETELLAQGKGIIESLAARLAERGVGRGIGFHAWDAKDALQGSDDLVLVAVYPGVEGLDVRVGGRVHGFGSRFLGRVWPIIANAGRKWKRAGPVT